MHRTANSFTLVFHTCLYYSLSFCGRLTSGKLLRSVFLGILESGLFKKKVNRHLGKQYHPNYRLPLSEIEVKLKSGVEDGDRVPF